MRVLCDAVAFGFGPVGKLLTIRSLLPREWEFTLLGAGTSLALASESHFDRIITCDTSEWHELVAHYHEFARSDIFLNIMNPTSASYALKLGIPLVEIDSLFWMWKEVPTEFTTSDFYFIQNFVGVSERSLHFEPGSATKIGPIVGRLTNESREIHNQLIVGLGGMRSFLHPHVNQLSYPKTVADILRLALSNHSFDQVIIAGDLESLKSADWDIPRSRYVLLGHDEFLAELVRSKAAILSPGLTATYEAFSARIPVGFLFPQNFSQWFILQRLRAVGAAPLSLHWLDFFPDVDLSLDSDEASGVKTVISVISRSDEIKMQAAQRLGEIIAKLCGPDLLAIQGAQERFFASMGDNGAVTIAEILRRL